MAAACKHPYVAPEKFVFPSESYFASETRTREYHAEVQATMVDTYDEMRSEKLIAGTHVDHVKACFDGVLS
eukprot:2153384-Pleurochrysis_carterae.AAC.1